MYVIEFVQISDTKIHKGVKYRNIDTAEVKEEDILNSVDELRYKDLEEHMLRYVMYKM